MQPVIVSSLPERSPLQHITWLGKVVGRHCPWFVRPILELKVSCILADAWVRGLKFVLVVPLSLGSPRRTLACVLGAGERNHCNVRRTAICLRRLPGKIDGSVT